MKKQNNYNVWKKNLLKDPTNKILYEEELIQAEIAMKIVEEREKQHLTQAELARRAKTTQSVIARLESFQYANCTIRTLQRIGRALGKNFKISFS